MAPTGIECFKQVCDALEFALPGLEQSPSAESRLTATFGRAMLESYRRVIVCAQEGKPFIATSSWNAPELFVALDLPWYSLSLLPYLPTWEQHILEEVDEAAEIGLGTDMCTLIRLGITNVRAGRVPVPNAFVGLLTPCDAMNMLHQTIARNTDWRNIPIFCTDPPYWETDRGIDFHAEELREMVTFLEEHTGSKFDVDRLRQVTKESNNQYQLWSEYNELRRAVPCPHNAGRCTQASNVAQSFMVGDPRGTEWFRQLVEMAEQRVRAGEGSVPNERIRLFWFDIPAVYSPEIARWLKDEWGACVVMDMVGYAPYMPIDTSSEASMFRDLARRNFCDLPMIRQARGTADTLVNDMVRVVRDYKIDCVIWPAHMGHKDCAASIGIMQEVCRDLGVPFLALGLDLFDNRYTKVDILKDRFSKFFTAMSLG